jgi:hypothetical protein
LPPGSANDLPPAAARASPVVGVRCRSQRPGQCRMGRTPWAGSHVCQLRGGPPVDALEAAGGLGLSLGEALARSPAWGDAVAYGAGHDALESQPAIFNRGLRNHLPSLRETSIGRRPLLSDRAKRECAGAAGYESRFLVNLPDTSLLAARTAARSRRSAWAPSSASSESWCTSRSDRHGGRRPGPGSPPATLARVHGNAAFPD